MDFRYVVKEQYDGKTLREIMTNELSMSNTMIKRVKLYGILEVNGIHRRVIDTVRTGDQVFASYNDDSGDLKNDPEIPIIYEDRYLAVVRKPAGTVTHPSHNHLDDSLITRLSDKTLHPVMRLDRETSGLLVIAKNGFIHNAMTDSDITKKYVAAVYGAFDPKEGIIEKNMKRRENSVMIRDTVPEDDPDGKKAVTLYKTIVYDEKEDISLVGYKLITGRCHQIRVHSLSEGHPLVGDGLYGPNSEDNPSDRFPRSIGLDKKIGRQALHAYYLQFTHPVTKEIMTFKDKIPDDIRNLFSDTASDVIDEFFSQI
ncbi:MAG: RluA family pseudouridine synthase [Clostridiales bacterium]|nr:RluA family pseudouridine synthase [Clostridiales bacterium]